MHFRDFNIIVNNHQLRLVAPTKHQAMKIEKIIKKVIQGNTGTDTKIAIAVIAGAAVGAALAVLLAPDRGSEIRKSAGNSGKRFTDQLKDIVEDLKHQFFDAEKQEEEEVSTVIEDHRPVKKPKSDIKELIHEAHQAQNGSNQ